MMKKGPVITIMGPTASGKTDLACKLSEKYPVKLISVDSAQIYRYMDIGTAKPDKAFLEKYPHSLIDICNPEDDYSVAQFTADAKAIIQQTHAENKIPVLVGGSMLYFHSLFNGLSDLPPANESLRKEIDDEIAAQGLNKLYQELACLDPVQAAKIAPQDRQRICRMIELIRLTGKTPTQLYQKQIASKPDWDTVNFALLPDRATLHQRIEVRFNQMIEQGFVREMEMLYARPQLSAAHPSMRSAGYQQFWRYLSGEVSRAEATELSIIASRQLAKRQITWMNNRMKKVLLLNFIDPLESSLEKTVTTIIDTNLKI